MAQTKKIAVFIADNPKKENKKLINNLNEDYCSIEVSKLLKDKKCCVLTERFYYSDSKINAKGKFYNDENKRDGFYNSPTHALAIKWIRENFGIHIYTHGCGMGFYCYVLQRADGVKNSIIKSSYGGPKEIDGMFSYVEQAIEAALLYTLQNLIK